MGHKVLQHHSIIAHDLQQPGDYTQRLDVIWHGKNLPDSTDKSDTSIQLDTLLSSFVPLDIASDMHSWTSQMVEPSYSPQSTMTPLSGKIIKTFIAYADNEEHPQRRKANEGYRAQIYKILQMISTQICKLECTWQEIAMQNQWEYEDNLRYMHLILLLVDDNFIITKYCFSDHIKHAVERHRSRTAYVVPIYLRSCVIESVSFANIQFFPTKIGKSVSEHGNKETAYNIIRKGLVPIAKDIRDRILQ